MANSRVTITGDGSTRLFTVPFSYVNQSDVKVQVVTASVQSYPTFVFVSSGQILLDVAPANGASITIYRETANDALNVSFNNNYPIRADDLNDALNQLLYTTQENEDDVDDLVVGGVPNSSITSAKIADNAVTTAKINALAVTNAKLATDAVATANIINANVTTAKIADSNVTTAKIADTNVTTAKIADLNVTTAKIADSAVTSAKIADDTIVNADINSAAAIADTKLATISTAGKVSNSATTATAAANNNTIVLRDGTAGTAVAALTASSVACTGAITTSSSSVGIGYATGAGGTVTQATSRTTAVTLNRPSGAITTFSKTTTAGLVDVFTVNNSCVGATDSIIVSHASGGTAGQYIIYVAAVAAGSFQIAVYTPVAQASAAAPVINFALVDGVTA